MQSSNITTRSSLNEDLNDRNLMSVEESRHGFTRCLSMSVDLDFNDQRQWRKILEDSEQVRNFLSLPLLIIFHLALLLFIFLEKLIDRDYTYAEREE